MAGEPNWGKHGTIATWTVGGLAILLAILAYVRPPDPAHPMRFDFISAAVSIPLWLLVIAVPAMVLITAAMVRMKCSVTKRPPADTLNHTTEQVHKIGNSNAEPPLTGAKPSVSVLGKPPKDEVNPLVSSGGMDFVFSTPDDVAIKVERNEDSGMKGLIIRIVNHRLSAIGRHVLAVSHGRSFDQRHNAYRDGYAFEPFILVNNGPILASCVGDSIWLVRKPIWGDHLLVGNDTQHELRWPDADNSSIHKWSLSIGVDTFIVSKGPYDKRTQLTPLNTELIFVWNRDKNEFFIEQ